MSKKSRKRSTTSVSTLVSQITYLRTIATVSGRKDLLKQFNLIAIRVNKLCEDYVAIRKDLDPFVKVMITDVKLEDTIEESDEVEVDEVEIEKVEVE